MRSPNRDGKQREASRAFPTCSALWGSRNLPSALVQVSHAHLDEGEDPTNSPASTSSAFAVGWEV